MRIAEAIHVVERGTEIENLRQRNDVGEGIWETAYWIVGEKTANSLIGGKVFVHRGQNAPSHAGGRIIDIYHESGTAERRRVIRFQTVAKFQGIVAERDGWGNERKIIWKTGTARQRVKSEKRTRGTARHGRGSSPKNGHGQNRRQ